MTPNISGTILCIIELECTKSFLSRDFNFWSDLEKRVRNIHHEFSTRSPETSYLQHYVFCGSSHFEYDFDLRKQPFLRLPGWLLFLIVVNVTEENLSKPFIWPFQGILSSFLRPIKTTLIKLYVLSKQKLCLFLSKCLRNSLQSVRVSAKIR